MECLEKIFDKILHRDTDREAAHYIIDKKRKEVELAHKFIKQELIDQGKQEKIYQMGFSAILFIAGAVLLFKPADKSFLEMGLFAIGSGLYGISPQTGKKKRSTATGASNHWLWISTVSFILMVGIMTLLYFVFPSNASDSSKKIGQILWVILGIMTMCFVNAFKQFINNRTD